MDGWGIAENPAVSAIDAANTPFYDHCKASFPNTTLRASEEWVGLPEGQMGNSEVGHMNIGAGRVVYQELVRIGKALREGEIRHNAAFKDLISYCLKENKPLHLMGLVSDGGVHSHIEHLELLIEQLAAEGLKEVYIHVFTDGRDCDPLSGLGFIERLEQQLSATGIGKIASVCGRYYAMDRDQRWGRVRKAYDLLTHGFGKAFHSASAAIRDAYELGETDEFILPRIIKEGEKPVATIQPGDAVLVFNFRTDRARQLTEVLTQKDNREYNLHKLELKFVTFTRYDESFEGVEVIFEKDNIENSLGEILAKQGKKQIRIAETEKYPHVTFFFNGGQEQPFEGETRILCPSPKVATYDQQPEMSAAEIRDKIIPELEKGEVDFVCLNFANPDMVGHTGVFAAAVRACETVDACTRAVAEAAVQNGYTVLITADHGNCDKMINPDGSPHTAHTTALVPFILMESHIDQNQRNCIPENAPLKLRPGKLGDIAPTILTLMGLPIPPEMTGEILISN